MRTIARTEAFLAAAAALAAIPDGASALLTSHDTRSASRQTFGRPSFMRLEANQQPFSELDKLKAKRLGLRRRVPEPDAEAAIEKADLALANTSNENKMGGLEYLYENGQERHEDDLFHIILMPSTFNKDHMSLEHATNSCIEVLGMPSDKAHDISLFAKHQGFSNLGTWTRDECLSMGEKLLSHDLDCRIIPFNGAVEPERLPEMKVETTEKPLSDKAFLEDSYLLSL